MNRIKKTHPTLCAKSFSIELHKYQQLYDSVCVSKANIFIRHSNGTIEYPLIIDVKRPSDFTQSGTYPVEFCTSTGESIKVEMHIIMLGESDEILSYY